MRAVDRRTFSFILAGAASLFSTASRADEREDAIAVAKAVIAALGEKKFALIWDTLASERYKNDMGFTRPLFVGGLDRPSLGRLTRSTVVYVRFEPPNPNWAFKGKTWAVMFENVYTGGTRQEGVVILEENGQFKMAGLSLGT